MMANMDPEQLKEMQQMQGGFADLMNPDKAKERLEGKTEAKTEARREGGGAKRRS